MINAEQIRAARALLDWSTADLARLTGLTVNGLNKIERGHVQPYGDTLVQIQTAFEQAGLEFLPFSGVKKKDQFVQVWEGSDACVRLLDDIYFELRDTGGEILVSGVNEKSFVQSVGEEHARKYLERLAEIGVKERLLLKEGDMNFLGPVEAYRWLPEKYYAPDSFLIYGCKLALVVWQAPQSVVVMNDARLSESLRKIFDFVWGQTKGPRMMEL